MYLVGAWIPSREFYVYQTKSLLSARVSENENTPTRVTSVGMTALTTKGSTELKCGGDQKAMSQTVLQHAISTPSLKPPAVTGRWQLLQQAPGRVRQRQ